MTTPVVYIDGRRFVPELPLALKENATLADYLVALRQDRGLTINEVSEITGISTWRLEAVEKETSTLSFTDACLLARVYGASLDLFGACIMRFVDQAKPGGVAPYTNRRGEPAPVQGAVRDELRQPVSEADAVAKQIGEKAATAVEPAPVEEEEVPAADALLVEDMYVDDSDDYIEEEDEDEDEDESPEPPAPEPEPEPEPEPVKASNSSRLQSLLAGI